MKVFVLRYRSALASGKGATSKSQIRKAAGLLGLSIVSVLASCSGPGGSKGQVAYYLSHRPDDQKSRPLRHYPVARQGNLTAWVTSDHVGTPENWLYAPGDPKPKYPIVGRIRARNMPAEAKHDGSLLVVSGYNGPIYDLWQGASGEGRLFTGSGWVPVWVEQKEGVNTWVHSKQQIGGWSGYPVVIGDPAKPDAVVGAMWYRHNIKQQMGGTTSSRFLQKWLSKLKLADFVKKGG